MQLLADRVLHWAQVQPTKMAIDDGSITLSYGELGQKAMAVARHLRSLGVQSNDRVVILLPKYVDAVVAIIGTLLAGATYVPVDTGAPRARLQGILEDSNPRVLITNSATSGWFENWQSLNIGSITADAELEPLIKGADTDADAYVLYTSGSTGVPNGVRISHEAMLTFFSGVNAHLGISRHSRCMNTSALYFDVSIADLMLPLYQGASVWLGPNIPLPFRFIEIITSHRITHFCAVGSTLTMLSTAPGFYDHHWEHVACIMTGAEVLNLNTIASWLEVCPQAIVCNGYGPTEATCVCTVFEITRETVGQHTSFPIGVPLPNVSVLIDPLEDDHNGTGELCVSGPQVMNGYLNRDSLNQARMYIQSDTRYYRTGDKVRKDDSGQLIFLGRIDDQIKVNGYRVDLGDVAEPFRNSPGVEEAVALPLIHSRYGSCLGVVVKTQQQDLDLSELRRAAGAVLPSYMRPSLIAVMNRFPLSASGKVNVKEVRAIATLHFLAVDQEVSAIERSAGKEKLLGEAAC